MTPKESPNMSTKNPVVTKPACLTPHLEQNGKGKGWLGNPRFNGIPAVPKRDRAQQVITDDERAKATQLLADYRSAKAIRSANDLQTFNEHLERVTLAKQWSEVQLMKKQIAEADHGKFVEADAKMRKLEGDAAAVVKPALSRLVESYDSELVEYSAQRESELLAHDLPIFEDTMKDGREYRHYALWADRVAISLHSCREVARERLQAFSPTDHYSEVEKNSRFAISTLVFLATSEPFTSVGIAITGLSASIKMWSTCIHNSPPTMLTRGETHAELSNHRRAAADFLGQYLNDSSFLHPGQATASRGKAVHNQIRHSRTAAIRPSQRSVQPFL